MGSAGDAYDNAMAESFFATLECELLHRHRFATRTQARVAVLDDSKASPTLAVATPLWPAQPGRRRTQPPAQPPCHSALTCPPDRGNFSPRPATSRRRAARQPSGAGLGQAGHGPGLAVVAV